MSPRARGALAIALTLAALFVGPHAIHAGAIWTDANDDGLPDSPGTLVVAAGDVVSVDLWIDSQSFAWTNFLVYAEWTPGCFTYVSAQYIIADGTNFPIDTFSHPSGVGFGGFTYSHQGVSAIGTINVRALTAGVCCVTPIIDPYNPYYTFSQLGTNTEYFLFASNPNSCWTVTSTPQACCFVNGSCAMMTSEACAAAGGAPQGQGSTCGSVDCTPVARGACCAPNGACTDNVTAAECAASGGTYQGDQSDCATTSCPQPTGACCFTNGSCQILTSADCSASGGDYRGNFTNCATAGCPPPSGACCLPTGGCAEQMPATQCAAIGGIYLGDGVLCSAVICPEPLLGACCLADGACASPVTAVQCASFGGTYQGNGSDCATVMCAGPVGACCYPSGACVSPMSASECASGGGTYQGDGTDCSTVSCPQPEGACCFADASCQMLTSAACSAAGGEYRGTGTSCTLVDCSPPEGACCLADGSCEVRTSAACTASGGEYQGDGTPCSAVNCAIAGACCLPTAECADDYTAEQCAAAGGVYLGNGETCAASVCGSARIWTDANADGLPDTGPPITASQGDVVSMDLWIDSQGFRWTNYLAYVEWPPGCMTYDSAQYLITGGANFPIDDFSNPSAIGFGGSGFDEIGIDRIGRVRVRLDAPIACCVTPIIDINNPFYTFSQLGSPSGYRLFGDASGSCWQANPVPEAGACCYPNGACDVQTVIVCTSFGGVFQGEGVSCATADCPQPGACCIPNFGCVPNNTEEQCAAAGGVFLGDGTVCGAGACTGTRIWTDANLDGLPDLGAPFVEVQGNVVTMDLWIDSQGFQWTNYLAFVEWPAACMSFESAQYLISGGSNFPIDDFSHPSGIGFGGSGYNELGIDRIGRVSVRLDAPVACCVTPIIDEANPFYVFSQLGSGPAFRLFDNQSGSCWQTMPPPATGACCLYSPVTCQTRTESQCETAGGTYLGDGTSCATDSCPPPPPTTGACCVANECVGEITQLDCESVGGTYRGDNTRCTTPNICVPSPLCPPPAPGVTGPFAMKESASAGVMRNNAATPCALPASTNGTAANYRWYNVCSGYIWIYSALEAGEGVGVRFGGPSQPAVNGDNDIKRVITYFRNVCPNYNQTVDVFVDVDFEGDGCPNANLGTDLNLDPALRWNCSDFSVSMPCGVNDIIVRTVHDGGTSPSFATDGPFTATCDPNAPGRSYYYGVNGLACIPWRGADGTFDNFLYWLVLDSGFPCLNAVEPTTWGRIKGMYR